jgi:hypothetical protein
MKRYLVGMLAAAAVACGGSDTTTPPGGGSVGGGTSTAAFVIAPATTSCGGQPLSVSAVVIRRAENREIADVCTAAGENCTDLKNLNGLNIVVAKVAVAQGATAQAIAPGTYTVIDPNNQTAAADAFLSGQVAFAGTSVSNATCVSTSLSATAGTVTITAVSAAKVTGTYSLTVNGATKTGSFDVVPCSTGAVPSMVCNDSTGITCTSRTCI